MQMKNRTARYAVTVEWGDCDPANTVFYPRYFSWFDASARSLIEPVWLRLSDLMAQHDALACLLMEVSARLLQPSQRGQTIAFESEITAWENERFTIHHRGFRDGGCVIEGKEVRYIARPHPAFPGRMEPMPIPAEFRKAFLIQCRDP